MKTEITIELDTALLDELRTLASERGTCLLDLICGGLEEIVRQRKVYESARERALFRLKKEMDLQWSPPQSRDE